MLTDDEKKAATKLLRLLANEELIALAGTVTKDQLYLPNAEEALSAILAYTENAAELLRRKKVKREVLFRYLYNEGIPVSPMAEKNTIIQNVLKHWGSSAASLSGKMEDEDQDYEAVETPNRNQHVETNSTQNNRQLLTEFQASDSWQNNSLHSNEEDQEMALQFSRWFYQMLNASNPIFLAHNTTVERFGPQHFFQDATVSMLFVDRGMHHVENARSAEAVCKSLAALVTDQQLVFNPNLEPSGVKGLSDPHGMRVVIVCGTVHKHSEVVGPFEQQFGLVRDPFNDNNWKIKFTRLALSASHLSELPTLDFTRKLLNNT